jgi:hypothetical protein
VRAVCRLVVCRLVRFGQIPTLSGCLAMVCSDVDKKKVKRAILLRFEGSDVIGLSTNRRSQRGDMLPAGLAMYTRVCWLQACLHAVFSACGSFAPILQIHTSTSHAMRCFFFVRGVAWLAGRALCMQAGESEVAARVASDLSHMAMV